MGLRAVTDHGPTAHVVAVLSAQELRLQMADSNVVGCPPTLSRGLLDKLNEMTGREDTVQSLEGGHSEGGQPCSGHEESRGSVHSHRRQWQHPRRGKTRLTGAS